MSKEIVFLVNVVASMYFMGGMLAQHEKVKSFIASIDNGFMSFVLLIKDQKPVALIRLTLKFFGSAAALGFLGMLVVIMAKIQSQLLLGVLSTVFLISTLLSGSLFWVLHHKDVLRQLLKWVLYLGCGSLMIPVIDILSGANMTHIVAVYLSYSLQPILSYTPDNTLFSEGLYVSSVYVGLVFFLYFVSWFYAGPTAVIACVLLVFPIFFARFINKAFPEKPVVIVFFALWFFSLAKLTFG